MHEPFMTEAVAIAEPELAQRPRFDEYLDWWVATRPRRVLFVLVALWLINAFDIVLTVAAHQQGLLNESNPIAARLLVLSPMALLVYKLAMVAFSSTVLLIHRRLLLAEIAATGTMVIYAIVAVRWRLCYELYDLTFYTSGMIRQSETSPLALSGSHVF